MTLPPIAFTYLRHGQTDWNAHDLAQGRSDIALNETGRAQAHAAAAALAAIPIARIVASPLGRAQETARIVAAGRSLVGGIEIEPGLVEADFGAREQTPLGPWYDEWLAGREDPADRLERFTALAERAGAALARHLGPGGPVLFVAHGALFRAIRRVLGHPPGDRLPNAIPLACTPDAGSWRIAPLPQPD